MKFLDAILGRTPEVKANLDALFALPSAVISLQVSAGLVPSGQAAVCYKPAGGQSFAATQAELEDVLKLDAGQQGSSVREEADTYGYRWVVLEHPLIEDLVNRAHMVNATLSDAGFGPQLLCSVFGLHPDGPAGPDGPVGRDGPVGPDGAARPDGPAGRDGPVGPDGGSAYLVYLFKRGTFYPFAPCSGERRDNELELLLKGILDNELPVEQDLTRWFPLWGLPLG